MPSYTITAPNGAEYDFDAPDDRTAQKYVAAFSSSTRFDPDVPVAPARGQPGRAQMPAEPRARPEQDESLTGRFRESLAGVARPIVAGLEGQAAVLTGATGGLAGMVGGALRGLSEEFRTGGFGTDAGARRVANASARGAAALTYAPRTAQGRGAVAGLAPLAEPLVALGPLAQATTGAASVPGALIANRAGTAAVRAGEAARAAPQAVRDVPARLRAAVASRQPASAAASDSVGAARVADARLRVDQAGMLPVPFRDRTALTEGQATRDFARQQFERETAKNPEIGAPIRERFTDQNEAIVQNLDAFENSLEPSAQSLRDVGTAVDTALGRRVSRDRKRIKAAYTRAEEAGELEALVALNRTVELLNETAPEAAVANVLVAARARALAQGIATEGPDGQLIASPVSLKTAELFRRSVRNATNEDRTNQLFSGQIRRAIDEETSGLGGGLYRAARQERVRFARDYENVRTIISLLGTKGNTTERAVALENVLDRAVLSPSASVDSVKQLRRLLQTEGPEGFQAWREVQAATIRHIRDEALKGVSTNERGQRMISPAQMERVISNLDKGGKLDFMFGKQGAEQVRLLLDVTKSLMTSPPNAVNTSNTASALLTALDTLGTFTMTGLPVPVVTALKSARNMLKDRALRARVDRALNYTPPQ